MIEMRIDEFPLFAADGQQIGLSFSTTFWAYVDPETDDLCLEKIAINGSRDDIVIDPWRQMDLFRLIEREFMKDYEHQAREKIAEDAAGRRTDARIAQMREAV